MNKTVTHSNKMLCLIMEDAINHVRDHLLISELNFNDHA